MDRPLYQTTQQVFDKICDRLDNGKGRAYSAHERRCVYRTSSGLPCVIGALVPTGHPLDPAMRMASGDVASLIHQVPEFLHLFAEGAFDKRMLSELQHLHDDSKCWKAKRFIAWNKVALVAKHHNVTFNPEKYHA